MNDPRSSKDPNLTAALKAWAEASLDRDKAYDDAMRIRTALYGTAYHQAYGWAALTCGRIAAYRQQLDLAETLLTEALGHFLFVGDKYGESVAVAHLAIPETLHGNLDHALELALKALASGIAFSDHDADLVHNIAAQCHWARDECHPAILHLTKAYDLVKNSHAYHRRSVVIGNIGTVLQELGEWDLALAASTEAWRLQLDHCPAQLEFALSHLSNILRDNLELGHWQAALANAEHLLRIMTTRDTEANWTMFENMSEAFALNGRLAQAADCLARSRLLEKSNPTAYSSANIQNGEAVLLEARKDYKGAIKLAQEILNQPLASVRRSNRRVAAITLSRSYAALGNRAESARWKAFADEIGRDKLLSNILSSQIRTSLKPEQPTAPLTEHEITCLSLSAQGQTSADIALKLGVKPRTINFHFTKILRKLNAMNRQEAIAKASEANLLRRL